MVAIVDYKAGNLTSVRLAFEALGVAARVSADPGVIRNAQRVVFPGVGAAAAAMRNLEALGLTATLRAVVQAGVPFLGICLGTQIVCDRSEENGGVDGLGLIAGDVRGFRPRDPRDKVPHMGWNSVHFQVSHPVFEGIPDGSHFYFVHSFYPLPRFENTRLAVTEYAQIRFASILGRENLVATQFHPEKSGPVGLDLLRNFCRWDGRFSC